MTGASFATSLEGKYPVVVLPHIHTPGTCIEEYFYGEDNQSTERS